MLAYDVPTENDDNYICIGASTRRTRLLQFVNGISSLFGEEYLRSPTITYQQWLFFATNASDFRK